MKILTIGLFLFFSISTVLFSTPPEFTKLTLPSNGVLTFGDFAKPGYIWLSQNDSSAMSKRLYISSDYGNSWFVPDSNIIPYETFYVDKNDRIYTTNIRKRDKPVTSYIDKSPLFYSDDYCQTWEEANIDSMDFDYLKFIPSPNPEYLYLNHHNAILRYDIKKNTMDTILRKSNGQFAVDAETSNYFYLLYEDDKIFVKSNGFGTAWDTVNSNFLALPAEQFTSYKNIIYYYAYWYQRDGVYRSDNYGLDWYRICITSSTDYVKQFFFHGKYMFVVIKSKLLYAPEPYSQFEPIDLSSFVTRKTNKCVISSDDICYVQADDTTIYRSDFKSAGLSVNERVVMPYSCSVFIIDRMAVIRAQAAPIGRVYLSDISGRLLLSNYYTDDYCDISLAGFAPGMYFISVLSPGGNYYTEKILLY